jgi:hypothetical protein
MSAGSPHTLQTPSPCRPPCVYSCLSCSIHAYPISNLGRPRCPFSSYSTLPRLDYNSIALPNPLVQPITHPSTPTTPFIPLSLPLARLAFFAFCRLHALRIEARVILIPGRPAGCPFLPVGRGWGCRRGLGRGRAEHCGGRGVFDCGAGLVVGKMGCVVGCAQVVVVWMRWNGNSELGSNGISFMVTGHHCRD